MSILLVEDDRDLAELWCEYLRGRGHQITACHSVAEAREAIPVRAPRLLIVDYTLPDGTALDVLEFVASQPVEAKVIVCSGHGHDLPVRVFQHEVHVLAKPFRLDTLDHTITSLLA